MSDQLVIPAANTGMFGKYVPGTLTVSDGRLAWATEDAPVFDVPISELQDVKFGFGNSVFKVKAAGKKYRFYFGKTAEVSGDGSVEVTGVGGGYGEAKGAGTQLREALGL